jgi:hypothetical protein
MNAITTKLESLSFVYKDERCWNKDLQAIFRAWLIRYLRRNAKVRNELINAPRSKNNLTAVLESFADAFIFLVPFKMVNAIEQKDVITQSPNWEEAPTQTH